MSHFNLKSLTFYGVMIGSVLILFNAVTAYGEKSLKAPPKISGTYELTSSKLPDCLQSEKINLIIKQSGIYVFAHLDLSPPDNPSTAKEGTKDPHALTPEKKASILDETIKLNGLMESQPFSVTGKTDRLGDCAIANDQNVQDPKTITLQIKFPQPIPPEKTLSGNLSWSSFNFDFTGKAQEELKPEGK